MSTIDKKIKDMDKKCWNQARQYLVDIGLDPNHSAYQGYLFKMYKHYLQNYQTRQRKAQKNG